MPDEAKRKSTTTPAAVCPGVSIRTVASRLVASCSIAAASTRYPRACSDRTSASASRSSATPTATSASRVNRGSTREDTARPPTSAQGTLEIVKVGLNACESGVDAVQRRGRGQDTGRPAASPFSAPGRWRQPGDEARLDLGVVGVRIVTAQTLAHHALPPRRARGRDEGIRRGRQFLVHDLIVVAPRQRIPTNRASSSVTRPCQTYSRSALRASPGSARRPRARPRGRAATRRLLPRKVCASMARRGAARSSGLWRKRRREVAHLHPALRAPAQELDLLGARCSLRTTAVVPSYSSSAVVDDEAALAQLPRHRRARVRRRVLDVRPVDVAPRERPGSPRSTPACRRGCRRSGRRPRTCRAGAGARSPSIVALPTVRPSSRRAFLAPRLQEARGPRRGRSRCRGTRSGSRPAASAAPASRRARRSTRSSPARCSRCR